MAETVHIRERTGLCIAGVMARKHTSPGAIGGALGVDLSGSHGVVGGAGFDLMGVGPGAWLAVAEPSAAPFVRSLEQRLGALASVSDLSGSYVVLRLSGSAARTILQRGASIDLHPSTFRPGSAAVTVIAHMGVIIRQVDEAPTYDVAMFRSYLHSFRAWLDAAMAAIRAG